MVRFRGRDWQIHHTFTHCCALPRGNELQPVPTSPSPPELVFILHSEVVDISTLLWWPLNGVHSIWNKYSREKYTKESGIYIDASQRLSAQNFLESLWTMCVWQGFCVTDNPDQTQFTEPLSIASHPSSGGFPYIFSYFIYEWSPQYHTFLWQRHVVTECFLPHHFVPATPSCFIYLK